MLALADAAPVGAERAGRPPRRQAVGRSAQDRCDQDRCDQDHYDRDRCDIAKYDKPGIERDAFPPYNHRGTVVVGCAWLAFYVIALFY
jgi:hypothetical protein